MDTLNKEELEFVRSALNQRLKLYQADPEHKKTKDIKNCLEKLEYGENPTSSEMAQVYSWINENFNQYSIPGFNFKSAFSWISITAEQQQQATYIDLCKDLLYKTGYFKNNGRTVYNKDFRYRTVFEIIEKLQKSETVFVSKYHKIGFVYDNKETLSFELRSPIPLTDNYFHFGCQNVEAFGNGFDLKFSKREALDFIAKNADKIKLTDEDFKFLTYVLSNN
jgi:hypothetical protein